MPTGSKFPERQVVAKIPFINWQHYISAYSGDRVIPQVATRNTLKSQHKQGASFFVFVFFGQRNQELLSKYLADLVFQFYLAF